MNYIYFGHTIQFDISQSFQMVKNDSRNQEWLDRQLGLLLESYFSDIKISNPVEIKFGREAKFRFGSIKLLKPRGIRRFVLDKTKPQKSVITITSMFANEDVPEDVVRYTIAHELCHFAHGFSSYNKRLFKHPHHGGVVNRELTNRGAEPLIQAFKEWLRTYRKKILAGRVPL